MKRLKRFVLACLAAVGLFQFIFGGGAVWAESPTTTLAPRDTSQMSAMEWVQSLRSDPAFSGFAVERGKIIVAQVPGRTFADPLPLSANLVVFVDASLSAQEFSAGRNRLAAALGELEASILGVSYDPLDDEITIVRESDPAAAIAMTNAAIDQTLVEVFGPAAEGVGHHIEVAHADLTPSGPERNDQTPGVGEPTEVLLVCEDDRLVSVRENSDPGFQMWPRPGVIDGDQFGTEWAWFCRPAPGTSGIERLVYTLLVVVVALGATLFWALSTRSDLQRQLWNARNPKSQQAL